MRVVAITKQYFGTLILLSTAASSAWGQKSVHCQDGDHILIEVNQIAIQYDGASFAGTLSSLSLLSGRLEATPKRLQEAAAATQQWNEFVKGLVAGYNSCAVTRQQYSDGLNRIYPMLKTDAADLEAIRRLISDGRDVNTEHLQTLIDSFWKNLQRFARASGKEIILQRIEALSEQVATSQKQIQQNQALIIRQNNLLMQRMKELEKRNSQAPVPTPTEVQAQITELHKELLAKAEVAEQAYNRGYALLDQFRFKEAVPYLQEAVSSVPLPEFHLALGRAYESLPDLPKAESILRQGLQVIVTEKDDRYEASIRYELGIVLYARGDLEGALSYAQRSLEIAEKVYGPDHPNVGVYAGQIGLILWAKGDLEGALSYKQRTLKIDEKAYGPDNLHVAGDLYNVSVILRDKGDLECALIYLQRLLRIDERAYGPEHTTMARDFDQIAEILQAKGDLEGALSYLKRALKIDEAHAPNILDVFIDLNGIGQILQAKGDLEGALSYTQRALKVAEKVYGPDDPDVARVLNGIGQILQAKGDLDSALGYAQRALKIFTDHYGPDNYFTRIVAANVKEIEEAKQAKQR